MGIGVLTGKNQSQSPNRVRVNGNDGCALLFVLAALSSSLQGLCISTVCGPRAPLSHQSLTDALTHIPVPHH